MWIPKYHKAVLTGEVTLHVRNLLRQMAAEHELEIVPVSQIMQWLEGISSRVLLQEFPPLRKKFWGRHFWARRYLGVSSGTITDEMIREYIDEQEGEQVIDDSRFPIDSPSTPWLPAEGYLVGHC